MARGPRRELRRQDAPEAVRLARVLPRVPGRARGPAPAALAPQPRPARAARLLGLARVLQPRGDLPERPARVPGARLPRSCASALGRACAGGREPFGRSGRPGRSRPRRCSCSASASASTSRRLERRHRRRARGCRRARAGSSTARRRTGTCRSGGDLEPCGPADADGQVRERIQTNGRCEAAIERGDTYGPVAYVAYVPAVLVFGWSGKWDSLPAAHATSIALRPPDHPRARARRASLRGRAARG